MATLFKLPDLGEGIHEAEVLAVLVSQGDEVKEGDPIVEVETDKAAVEIPSPFNGKVLEILIKPGDIVRVGEVLMSFSELGEAAIAEGPKPAEKIPATPAPKDQKRFPGRERGPVPASPATRRLARELGVDLNLVTPSGPAGLVTADDVRAFAESTMPLKEPREVPAEKRIEARPMKITLPPLPDFTRWGSVQRLPVRSIRRATAQQMSLAWSQIPHVTNYGEVDVTKLEEVRNRFKADIEAQGGKLTMTVFALKAAATALRLNPNFNATLDSQAGELIVKQYYHIGVAVDTEDGLIVPVIRNVDRKSIEELSIELNDLVQRTRSRKAKVEEMQGGTFTITNVGPMGGGHFAPIINYPEVAILGMGSARLKPVVKHSEGSEPEIVARLMLPIVLCIDHRVLDGADAMRFMRVFITTLGDPDTLLMKMV